MWYRFAEGGKAVFFSGDYTEDTQVYACDPIRGQSADLAVLDCAYGSDGAARRRGAPHSKRWRSGGKAVMTGTVEAGAYSEHLLQSGNMELLRYPAHQNRAQYELLEEKNGFAQTIFYHTNEFSAKREILWIQTETRYFP